ncbi:hypothetical protein [Microbacterium hydrocarbonoxydans]|uniref:hypothetical protein n=1 Tax=Microbacterium hydrocarbonoxydans TaxID=273678 RepID=UPI00203BC0FA|nr:hypothetical protein [Microbacterium hydrocarbonoxydans]MCM3778983.1 hypothetical protein [Microbacterium hydrocarbonoxydans]
MCTKCDRTWGPWPFLAPAQTFVREHSYEHLQVEKNDRRRGAWDEERKARQREYNRAHNDKVRRAGPRDPGIDNPQWGAPFAPGWNRRRP